jgi:WD40 repeat protein
MNRFVAAIVLGVPAVVVGQSPPSWIQLPADVDRYYGSARLAETIGGDRFFSPDGRELFVFGPGFIRAWDVESGQPVRDIVPTLRGPKVVPAGQWRSTKEDLPAIRELKFGGAGFAGNRDRLFLHTTDGIAFVVHPESGAWQQKPSRVPFEGKMSRLTADGNRVLYNTRFGLQVLETKTGKGAWEYASKPRDVAPLADITPDGRSVVLLSPSGALEVHTLADSKVRASTPWRSSAGDPGLTSALQCSPDGIVAALSSPRGITFFNLDPLEEIGAIRFDSAVEQLVPIRFSPDGKRLAASLPTGLRLYDTAALKLVSEYPDVPVSPPAFSPDGKLLAVPSHLGGFRFFDSQTGTELHRVSGHAGPITAAALSPDGRTLVTAGVDPELCVWDTAAGREIVRVSGTSQAGPRAIDLAADGRVAVLADSEGVVSWVDVTSGMRLLTEQNIDDASCLNLARDGRTLFVGSHSSPFRAIDVSNGRVLWTGDAGSGPATCAASTADGQWIVTWERNIGSRCRDARTGTDRWVFSPTRGQVRRVAVSPNGQWAAAANTAGEVFLIRLADGRRVETIETGRGSVTAVFFTPDGRTLGYVKSIPDPRYGPETTVLTVRELLSGQDIARVLHPAGPVVWAVSSTDGRTAYTAAAPGFALRWRLGPSESPLLPDRSELCATWRVLGDNNPRFARDAMARLASRPADAVQTLAAGMRPEGQVFGRYLPELIADLDSPRFAVRARADLRLRRLGWWAEEDLRKALAAPKSAEARERIEAIRRAIDSSASRSSSEGLGRARACAVLADLNTAAARSLLAAVAMFWPEAWVELARPRPLVAGDPIDVGAAIVRRAAR